MADPKGVPRPPSDEPVVDIDRGEATPVLDASTVTPSPF